MILSYLLPIVTGGIAGAVGAALLLWRQLRRQSETAEPVPAPSDPWVDAEIDQAAVSWATAQGRPEAAPLMADKLRLLHRLGSERRSS